MSIENPQNFPTMAGLTVRVTRLLVLLGLAFALIAEVVPAISADVEQAEQAVEAARVERDAAAQERADALDDLAAAVAAYEEVVAELEAASFRIARIKSRIEEYQDDYYALKEEAKRRAVAAYIRGSAEDLVQSLTVPATFEQSILIEDLVAKAVEKDLQAINALTAAESEMAVLADDLAAEEDQLLVLRADAAAIIDRMNALYAEADAAVASAESGLGAAEAVLTEERRLEQEERERAAEAQRRQEALAKALTGPAYGVGAEITPGFVCPIDGTTWFQDTWGAPRSGGRKHKGVDMFARQGTSLVAVGDGIVTFGYSVLGGNIAWVHADHGVSYFYAHLDRFAIDLRSGDRVVTGQEIGSVGDTGNAAPGAYHLHFGIYPGGNSAVNPYPTVARTCG